MGVCMAIRINVFAKWHNSFLGTQITTKSKTTLHKAARGPIAFQAPPSTPQTRMLDATLLSKCISGCDNTSHPIFNCPHVLKCMFCALHPSHPNVRCPTIGQMHFRLWHYLTTHFLLPPCPQNVFSGLSTPQTPMLGVPLLSKCILGCGTTPHPIFNCPDVLKCISCAINPSDPNIGCPTIVQMHFRLWHYLKTHFPLPPCPQNAFLRTSTPQTPMLGVPLLSKCILGCGTTPSSTASMSSNAFLAPSTPQTPILDAPLLSKCISGCGAPYNPISTTPMPSK